MPSLEGRTIAVAGTRKFAEIGSMIRNYGGTPLHRPAQETKHVPEDQVDKALQHLLETKPDWLILTTGDGVNILYQAARTAGNEESFFRMLRDVRLAVRGYKTLRFLREQGIEPEVTDDDGTVEGLIRRFPQDSLSGHRVVIQMYGETSARLNEWLERQGAEYEEILPYRHVPPPKEKVEQLIQEVIEQRIDAVVFTSSLQVRYLFSHVEQTGQTSSLLNALNDRVLASAVGKVTARELYDQGVRFVLKPERERMGAMIVTLADHFVSD